MGKDWGNVGRRLCDMHVNLVKADDKVVRIGFVKCRRKEERRQVDKGAWNINR